MDVFLKDNDRFVFIITENLLNQKDGVVFSDGYLGHTHQRYFCNDNMGQSPSKEIIETAENRNEIYGEWITVIKGGNNFEVITDYFGFYMVYYCEVKLNSNSALVISNCFNSLSDYVRESNKKIELDIKSIFPILTSTDVFFANNFSTSTANENIKSLRPDEKLLYCAKTGLVKIRQRNWISSADSVSSLLDQGSQFLSKNIKEISDLDINLFLSGGNDSRICLSTLISTLGKDKVKLTTTVPTGKESPYSYKTFKNDFKVANFIKEHLGLNWYKDNFRGSLEFTPDNYARYISKFRSNSYYSRLSVGNRLACSSSSEDSEVQVRGGAGEVLRVSTLYKTIAHKANKFGGFKNTTGSIKDDLCLVFDTVCPESKFSKKIRDESKQYFINYVVSYEGDNVEEKINNRFFLERNNRHFGHHREKLALGKRTFFPLANPYWYIAAKKFSLSERERKDFVNLVYNEFEPSVSELPFSGDAASKSLDYEIGVEKYNEFKSQQAKSHNHPGWKSSCNLSMQDYAKKEVHNMIEHIYSFSDSGKILMSDEVIAHVTEQAELGGSIMMTNFMKIKSVFDAIHPCVSSYKIYI
ncbi:hypothetical protein [Aeromonas veronii]|uniref:hypothetical protein n=1 Tax=Aeromonas veronii TaxID=654 RepID=UPI003D1E13FD